MYTGQVRNLRQALIDEGHVKAEELATMSDDVVVNTIKDHYVMLVDYDDNKREDILLLSKDLLESAICVGRYYFE